MTSPAATVAPRSTFAALHERNYALFISGAFLSNIGNWMQNLAVPYVVYQATHSAAWVGLAGFAQYAPAVLVSPIGGSVADRYPRRRVLLATQSVLALLAIGMWVLWIAHVRNPGVLVAMVWLIAINVTWASLAVVAVALAVYEIVITVLGGATRSSTEDGEPAEPLGGTGIAAS